MCAQPQLKVVMSQGVIPTSLKNHGSNLATIPAMLDNL